MIPPTARLMKLGDMVPADAWPEIFALIDAGQLTAVAFKPVLARYSAEMEANGVLPDYAAYALEAVLAGALP